MPALFPNPPMVSSPPWSPPGEAIASPPRPGSHPAWPGAVSSSSRRLPNGVVYHSLLAALVFLVFAPALNFEFSRPVETANGLQGLFRTPPRLADLVALWGQSYEGLYIPVAWTAWALLAWISFLLTGNGDSPSPAVFHSANVGMHLVSVFLVFSILRLILHSPRPGRASYAAFAGAALFAVHPLQVEPVAWTPGMKELLSAALALGAIRLYLENTASTGAARLLQSRRRIWDRPAWLFLAALLAHPSAIAAIPVAFLLEITFLTAEGDRRAAAKHSARRLLPWIILSLIVIVIAELLQAGRDGTVFSTPLWFRPLVVLDSLGFYLGKLIWPHALSPDYGRSPHSLASRGVSGVLWWLPLAAVGVLLVFKRGRKVNLLLLALFGGALLPRSGLMSLDFTTQSTVADRHAYLALLAASLVTAKLLLACRVPALRGAILLVVALFAVRSMTHLPVFTNAEHYCRHALTTNPGRAENHLNLADALREQDRVDEAISQYRILLRQNPEISVAAIKLGGIYYQRGNLAEAEKLYRQALQAADRNAPVAHLNLARTLSTSGKYLEADRHFLAAVRCDSAATDAYLQWGRDLERRNRFSYAAEVYQEGANPAGGIQRPAEEKITLRRLSAKAWWKADAATKCVAQLDRILNTAPEDINALNLLSWIKATSGEESLRDPEGAILLAEKMCTLTSYREPRLLDTLASAYASAQRYRRAIATLEKMVEVAEKADRPDLAQVRRVFRNRSWYYANAQPLDAENARPYSEFEAASLTAQVED